MKHTHILHLKGFKVEAHHGQEICFFYNLLGQHPRLLKRQAEVFLQCGGNDVSAGKSAASIIADLKALVARVHQISPRTIVVLGTIPVRGEWLDQLPAEEAEPKRRALLAVNAWIKTQHLAPIFDANTVVEDKHQPGYQRDAYERKNPNVHFNHNGYQAMSKALLKRAKELP